MEVSPKAFREVEFREKIRGYHPEDVDQFLEQMATGVEALQERLRQALERAQRAEQVAADTGTSDETLRRTLVLAQRTADMAVQEAREQAARLVAAAEQQAQATLADAEQRARRLQNEALSDIHAELAKLEATRSHSQAEVDALDRWAEEHRNHLVTALQDALAMLDRAGILTPPPASTPLDVPRVPARVGPLPEIEEVVAGPSPLPDRAPFPDATVAPPPPPAEADELALGKAAGGAAVDESPVVGAGEPPPGVGAPASVPGALGYGTTESDDGPDDEALDNFFQGDDPSDERRFGGRLRRRR
jgi:cell division initiation protein